MASFAKLKSGKIRAQVYRNWVRKSKAFPTIREAKRWAAAKEYELEHSEEINSRLSFGDLLDRYGREKSSLKKGAREEILRIERARRDPIAKVALGDLKVTHFADWRDRRLQTLKVSTARRELEQLSAVLRLARTGWALMSHNPSEGLTWPKDGPARDRLATDDEIEMVRMSAGSDLKNLTARAFHA